MELRVLSFQRFYTPEPLSSAALSQKMFLVWVRGVLSRHLSYFIYIFSCYVEYVETIGPSWKGVASIGFVIVWVWNAKQMFSLFPSQRYATTGIIALNLALHICQEVNIAGFGYPGNHDNTTPIHYYNTGRSRKEEVENASPSNWGVLHREACWQKPGLKELWALVAVTRVSCGNSCWGILGNMLCSQRAAWEQMLAPLWCLSSGLVRGGGSCAVKVLQGATCWVRQDPVHFGVDERHCKE